MGEKRKVTMDVVARVKRLRSTARPPFRATSGSVGYDIYAAEEGHIQPQQWHVVGTGISITPPKGTYVRIAPTSRNAANGLWINAGVVDPDYTGELKVCVHNLNPCVYRYQAGTKIAQIIFEFAMCPVIAEVDALSVTARGEGGFGSTESTPI